MMFDRLMSMQTEFKTKDELRDACLKDILSGKVQKKKRFRDEESEGEEENEDKVVKTCTESTE